MTNLNEEKIFEKLGEALKNCLEHISYGQEDGLYQKIWESNFVDGRYHNSIHKSKIKQKICRDKIENSSNYYELKESFSKIPYLEKLNIDLSPLLGEFIETYLFNSQKIEFDIKQFSITCNILEKHITQKYYDKFYFFTPIYGFDTEYEKFEMGEFKIENIIPKQFDSITNLDISNETEEPFIPFEYKELKYVLFFTIDRNTEVNPKRFSANFLSALRLTTSGSIHFGNFYRYHPLEWQGDYFPASKETPTILRSPYFLSKEHYSSFKEIYLSLNTIYDNFHEFPEKIRYLTYSIRRFDYSYRDHLVEDNITDLMISLETMVNNQPFEVRDKTSLRAAVILEDNDEEKINCKKFIQKCYDIRSEIVHGKKRSTKIKENEEVLSDEKIKEKLENYTRKAIAKMLKLQNKFNTQDEVLNRIDRFILNRGENLLD